MAVHDRLSFTVRRILDLPENDSGSTEHLLPLHSLSGSPYSSWADSDRGHCMCELPLLSELNVTKCKFSYSWGGSITP